MTKSWRPRGSAAATPPSISCRRAGWLSAVVTAILACAIAGTAVGAQPASPAATAAPQRGLAAEPGRAMALRMLACTPCHGREGRATNAGYFPRIAGKPAGYLFNQLVAFRDGRRHHAAMVELVQHMSDDYLREIAAYFAALELPYPPPQTAGAPAAVLERGARLVQQGDVARGLPACTACHGPRMTGALPAMPGLVGLPRDYLLGQLGAWRNGERSAPAPDCMATIARRLGAEDIEAVTLWLSAQPTQGDMRPVPATALTRPLPLRCAGIEP